MLLAVDVGNTNIVFALYEGKKKCGEWRSATSTDRTADEYAVWLDHVMSLHGLRLKDVSAVILSSVVPDCTPKLCSLCRRYMNIEPILVGLNDLDLGIEVCVDNPEQVGADRLVNVFAAFSRYGGPCIIIDFGTATTFDVLDERGRYIGGCICPGVNLSLEALYMAAAQLPRVNVVPCSRAMATSTVSAMQSGVYWGYVSLIEGLVRRLSTEFGQPMTVIATGGLASLFSEATDAFDYVEPDLNLRGLSEIYDRVVSSEMKKPA